MTKGAHVLTTTLLLLLPAYAYLPLGPLARLRPEATALSSNEALALLTLRHLASAEATFQSTIGKGRDFGTLRQLVAARLIDADLGRGIKHGYRFTLHVSPASHTRPSLYEAIARPLKFGTTGVRSFHMDVHSMIRESYAENARIAQMRPLIHECGTIECCETAAVSTMRSLSTAQATYQSTRGLGRRFGTLKQLCDGKFVDPVLGNGIKNGYLFRVRADPGSPTEAASFEVRAVPMAYGVTGRLSFYIDETFVLRGGDKGGAEAHSTDEPYPNP